MAKIGEILDWKTRLQIALNASLGEYKVFLCSCIRFLIAFVIMVIPFSIS
jgi:hypothetical protein